MQFGNWKVSTNTIDFDNGSKYNPAKQDKVAEEERTARTVGLYLV